MGTLADATRDSWPWACTTRQGSWDWVVYSARNPNLEICQMFHDGTDLNETGEAHAHLVTAAPAMFEALLEARVQVEILQSRLGIKDHGHGTLSIIDAALAKAGQVEAKEG